MRRAAMLGGLIVLALTGAAQAVDQPVSARRLVLRRTVGGQEKLSFLTKDPAFLFPAIGTSDDPATGSPGGVVIELFAPNQGAARIDVPSGAGWLVKDSPPELYKFVNKLAPAGDSPVRSLLIKSGRAIRLRAASVGFPQPGPLGKVGIRFTMGGRRTCALFDEVTVRRDEPNVFVAHGATVGTLTDCSNASLGGPTCADAFDAPTCGGTCPAGFACGTPDLANCECISAAQPCGDTAPVCNGECPAGEECSTTGGLPIPGCGCLPVGSTPCGNDNPTCGGDCPAGLSCFAIEFRFGPITLDGCQCLSEPPVDPCGGCPPGFDCIFGPGIGPVCLAFCNGAGGYPTCDGSCPGGFTCGAVSGFCLCQ